MVYREHDKEKLVPSEAFGGMSQHSEWLFKQEDITLASIAIRCQAKKINTEIKINFLIYFFRMSLLSVGLLVRKTTGYKE